MKIALDPYMFRPRRCWSCRGWSRTSASITSSSRRGRTSSRSSCTRGSDTATIGAFKRALAEAEVEVATVLPLFHWAGPDEEERQDAVRYWKRAIEITVELGVDAMNTEFSGRPEASRASEGQFWRSMEELLPIFEREGIQLRLEPHPDDFIEDGREAVDMIRGIDHRVSYLYCAPHTFHIGRGHRGRCMRLRRRPAHPPARGRLLRPPRLVRPALHRQPARLDRPRAPAPRHRPGRGGLGRVLRHARGDRVRRHHDRLRVRVGGSGRRRPHASCARSSPAGHYGTRRTRGPRRLGYKCAVRRLALTFAFVTLTLALAAAALATRPADLILIAALAAFPAVGGLLSPRHPLAWLLIAEGFAWQLGIFCDGWVHHGGPDAATWVLDWIWIPGGSR